MQSRTSFFDSRIYRNVLSRFWLIGLGCALLWAFTIFSGMGRSSYYMEEETAIQLLRVGVRGGAVICMLTCAVVAAAVYGWMFSTGSTAFTAALPLRRETVFVSDMAAGFTLLEGGTLAAVAAVGLLGGLRGAAMGDVLRFLAVVSLLNLFFFGFASVCACLTGSIVILPAVYAVLLYAAVALESSLRALAQFLIFGLTGSGWKLTALSPAYHLRLYSENLILTRWDAIYQNGGWNGGQRVTLAGFSGWPLLAGYAAAGIVFAALAAALVRRRPMESAGSVVAVPFLKKLFPWCAALAGALTMGLMSLEMVFRATEYLSVSGSFHQVCALLGFMVLGAFLGWFGAQGLLRRTHRVFDRSWGGFAAVCAVIAGLVLCCEADVFRVERAEVDLSRVGYVELYDTLASEAGTVKLSEPEDLAAALALQKKIVANKSVYENAGATGYYSNNALSFLWYDKDGNLLQSRLYESPGGATAWASCGDAYVWGEYVSAADAYVSGADAYASGGDALALWVTYGNAVPSGSRNPALRDLEDLLNAPEAIEQRLRSSYIPVSASSVASSYYYRMEQYMTVENYDLPAWEAWEVYSQCILPDAADGNIGRIQLCPVYDGGERGNMCALGITLNRGYGDNIQYDYLQFRITPEAERTCAWLAERDIYVPGYAAARPEPPAETVYDMPLEGLAALLDNVKNNYDPDASGRLVSMRWARSLLEWYTNGGEDVFFTYEDAKTYARTWSADGDVLPQKLERLRSAGLQLVSGGTGLVRDRGGARWTEDTVNDLFDALRAGLNAGSAS